MSPELESHLWAGMEAGDTPRVVIDRMLSAGMIGSAKQAWRTLEKWSRQGKYDWGVTVDLGWIVKDGMPVLRKTT